jgi:flagellar biosynthesis protein FlhF
MIIKSFVSDTVAGALKMVRSELGGDAVILKTRKLNQRSAVGGRVEVTACIDRVRGSAGSVERADVSSRSRADRQRYFPAEEIVQKLDFLIDVFQAPMRRSAFPGNIGQLFTAMLHADIPETMAYDLADRLRERFDPDDDYNSIASTAVQMFLDQLPKSKESYLLKTKRKIVLVGPAGSGKTSLMGRLAAYLVGERRLAVCLTSLDNIKVSAPEELLTYAEILDVDHFEMPREVDRTLLEDHGKDKVILIDTPALNIRDRDEIRLYAEKLARIKPHRVIGVFPATFRTSDLLETLRAYRPLELTEMAITLTDQTSRLGGMVALSIQSGLPISILGTGRRAGGIDLAPDHRKIIRSFLGAEEVTDDE